MARVDAPAMFAAGSSGAFGQHGLSLSGGAADATTSSHDIEREERPSGPGHTAAAEFAGGRVPPGRRTTALAHRQA